MPATAVGLVFASPALLRGRTVIVNGVVEAHGPLLRWALSRLIPNRGGASAITLGHVVLGCDAVRLESTRVHERVHVEQYERWGPLFLPAYMGASFAAYIRGGDYYFDNRFEREARDVEAAVRLNAASGAERWNALPCRAESLQIDRNASAGKQTRAVIVEAEHRSAERAEHD